MVAKPFSSSEISFAGSDVCEELEDFATSEDEETGVSCEDEIMDELVCATEDEDRRWLLRDELELFFVPLDDELC